jgi:hypothetical protein
MTGSVAVLALAAAAAVYVMVVGTRAGRRFDAAIVALELDGRDRVPAVWAGIVTNATTVTLATATLLLVVARTSGVIDSFLTAAVPCGAVALAAALKAVLPVLDPVHGESRRALGEGFFPSGHAAAGMGLCLAAMLARLPWWPVRPAVAALLATALACPHFLTAWHHPSDVAGALLITTAWAALLATWLRPVDPAPLIGSRSPAHVLVLPVLLLVGSGLLALAEFGGLDVPDPRLLLTAAVIAAVASACTYGLAAAVDGARASPRAPLIRA